MPHVDSSSMPTAATAEPHLATVRGEAWPRAKRLGSYSGLSYRRAKDFVARQLGVAMNDNGVTQRDLASAAGDRTHRIVQAWCDPDGSNGLRFDVAIAAAIDGDPEVACAMRDLTREVLAFLEAEVARKGR